MSHLELSAEIVFQTSHRSVLVLYSFQKTHFFESNRGFATWRPGRPTKRKLLEVSCKMRILDAFMREVEIMRLLLLP